jgi:Zn-finger nucleic acid-binding protein
MKCPLCQSELKVKETKDRIIHECPKCSYIISEVKK